MRACPTALPEVLLIELERHGDPRGDLTELHHQPRLAALGLPPMVQINLSRSRAGALRGLHYQQPSPQAKLVHCLRGAIYDVVVDLRPGSPTRLRHAAVELEADRPQLLYVPAGFAHGYYSRGESEVLYLLSSPYAPEAQRGLRWDDPTLAIPWPDPRPTLSDRDAQLPFLDDLP